jgi:hypothetical protein
MILHPMFNDIEYVVERSNYEGKLGKNIRYRTGIRDHHLRRTDTAANPGVLARKCYFLYSQTSNL